MSTPEDAKARIDAVHNDRRGQYSNLPAYTEVSAHIKDESGRLIPAKTKKALREAVKADPTSVLFRSVGGMNASFEGGVADLPVHATLNVV